MAPTGNPRTSETLDHQVQGNGDFTSSNDLNTTDSPDLALQKIRTAGSVTIPPELFEKLYLAPQNPVKGVKAFGNPTPL